MYFPLIPLLHLHLHSIMMYSLSQHLPLIILLSTELRHMLEDHQELKLHQLGWRTIFVPRPPLIIPLSPQHLTQPSPHQNSLLLLRVFILPLLIHCFFLLIWHIYLKIMWLPWLMFYVNQNQSIIHRLSNILSGKWPWTMNLLHWNRTTHGLSLIHIWRCRRRG